jgi:hypothetical protein
MPAFSPGFKAEGTASPADVILLVDAARLHTAAKWKACSSPFKSKLLV